MRGLSKANTNRTRPGYRRGYQKGRPAVTRRRPGHRRGCQQGKPTATRGGSRSRGTGHQLGGKANTSRTRSGHRRGYETRHPVGGNSTARKDGPGVRAREFPSVVSESIPRDRGYGPRVRGRGHGYGAGGDQTLVQVGKTKKQNESFNEVELLALSHRMRYGHPLCIGTSHLSPWAPAIRSRMAASGGP